MTCIYANLELISSKVTEFPLRVCEAIRLVEKPKAWFTEAVTRSPLKHSQIAEVENTGKQCISLKC